MTEQGPQKGEHRKEPIDPEKELMFKIYDPKQNSVINILRVHLLTEYYLERIIHLSLPRGDRIINEGRLSYYKKLVLVDSCNVLEDEIIQFLKGLNSIRNECAHELEKTISWADVELIAMAQAKQTQGEFIPSSGSWPPLCILGSPH